MVPRSCARCSTPPPTPSTPRSEWPTSAETGDPTRFTHARALVKHAGLCPRDNSSGTYQGKTAISGRGRPELRLAA
ncbi:MAG: transposase [Pseudonocardia sp.]